MIKIGVVLSGCGVMDGSEIQEAVLTFLSIAEHGAEAVCMAPDVFQKHVINHAAGKETSERRNVLEESARISRGKIRDLKTVKAGEIDGLIFPGGYGAAKNLSTFAFQGKDCEVHPEVARLAKEVHAAGKPIGAICIAPAVIAKIFEKENLRITIGNEKEASDEIRALGHEHVESRVSGVVIDSKNKIVTTPAYMLAKNIVEVRQGIDQLVIEVLAFVQHGHS